MEISYNNDGSPFVIWETNKIQMETDKVFEKYYVEKAEKELRETPEIVESALKELRELLKGDSRLDVPADKDEFLIKFLRPCKFYAASAFNKIQAYYKFRRNHEDFCKDLMPSMVRGSFIQNLISIMSPRDQYGRRIIYLNAARWNPQKLPIIDVFRGFELAMESAVLEPRTQVSGIVCLVDVKGLSLSQILHMTPTIAKTTLEWIQDCAPIRLKAVHIVNQPMIFNMLFAIFKPFIREKLRLRIHFHGSNRQSLLSHLDGKVLRKCHGGMLSDKEVPGDLQMKILQYHEDDFKAADSYGYINHIRND